MQKQRFGVSTPLATHFRQAKCEEVLCQGYENGWVTILDETAQADLVALIRNKRAHGRHYTEVRGEGALLRFEFAPGQQCFEKHMVKNDRPEIYTHQTPVGSRRFDRGADWTENMNEQLYPIKRAIEAG